MPPKAPPKGASTVEDNQPNRTDPRWIRTREAIIGAGQDLFGQHHPEGVSIDELIRVAKISKQSFYNHFPDKDALAREIIHIMRAQVDDMVTRANGQEADPARRLATGLCVYAAQALHNPNQGRLMARLMLEDIAADSASNSPVVNDIRAGLAQRRLAVFTLETGMTFVIGTGQAMISRILQNPHLAPTMTISQQFVILTLRAFGLPPIEAELVASEAVHRIMREGQEAPDGAWSDAGPPSC